MRKFLPPLWGECVGTKKVIKREKVVYVMVLTTMEIIIGLTIQDNQNSDSLDKKRLH